MNTLPLRIAAPMQSWGDHSRFDRRDTGTEPTKSGIIGLLCAALGRPRTQPINDLTDLEMGVRVDQPGILSSDFQTISNVPNTKGKGPATVVSPRAYLSDAVFLVALSGPQELLETLEQALHQPRWQLAYGRKAFVPTQPISLGLKTTGMSDTLNSHHWLATSQRTRRAVLETLQSGGTATLRAVSDTTDAQADDWLRDLPISYETRTFRTRPVRRDSIPLTTEMLKEPAWIYT